MVKIRSVIKSQKFLELYFHHAFVKENSKLEILVDMGLQQCLVLQQVLQVYYKGS